LALLSSLEPRYNLAPAELIPFIFQKANEVEPDVLAEQLA
jgi:hypothetical protein